MAQAKMGSSDGRIGVRDFAGCNALLLSTVKRLEPSYRGPFDPQALIEYLEALVLQARKNAEEIEAFATANRRAASD